MGYSDLSIGQNALPGDQAYCNQGLTYAVPNASRNQNEACGGYLNWGATDLEVWYPEPKV